MDDEPAPSDADTQATSHRNPVFALGRVCLRPFNPGDIDWLYALETSPDLIDLFRLRGAIPSPMDYQRIVYQNVLSQFVVEDTSGKVRHGLVMAFNPDFANGTAEIALIANPNAVGTGLVTDGMSLLIEYVFRTWNFRKLYGESLAINYERFKTEAKSDRTVDVDGLWSIEGCRKDAVWIDGAFRDKYLVTIDKADWQQHRDRIFLAIMNKL